MDYLLICALISDGHIPPAVHVIVNAADVVSAPKNKFAAYLTPILTAVEAYNRARKRLDWSPFTYWAMSPMERAYIATLLLVQRRCVHPPAVWHAIIWFTGPFSNQRDLLAAARCLRPWLSSPMLSLCH